MSYDFHFIIVQSCWRCFLAYELLSSGSEHSFSVATGLEKAASMDASILFLERKNGKKKKVDVKLKLICLCVTPIKMMLM